ncbi:MAG: hypothetical protein KF729_08520 [Sandaracinaceae bacterium]|nr:hypothetical protein [Sandaracinaceae bacterium]
MSSTDPAPVRAPELDHAIEALLASEHRAPLAALARDVLGSQAEGRALFAGAKLAKTKAEEHGVTHELAETSAGNLLGVIERGPKTPLERALVAAFAVAGLDDALAATEDDAHAVVFRFVRGADWLEVSSEYAVYALVDRVLREEHARLVWSELAQRVVGEAAGRDGDRAEVRARNAARLTALASSRAPSAVEALRSVIRSSALDEPTRLLASTLAGDGADLPAVGVSVTGRLGRAPGRGLRELVRLATGWALVSWALRGVAFLLGLRSEAELKFDGKQLDVRTRVSLLGRTVREAEETWRLDALEGASRRVRYPSLHLLVGALALSAGVLAGSLVLFDGVRSGELVLVSIAAAMVLAGAGLDLALDVLWSGQRGRVSVEVAPRSRRALRLTSVPLEQADAFLRALRGAATPR